MELPQFGDTGCFFATTPLGDRSEASERIVSVEYTAESPWLMSIQIGWEEQIYNEDLPTYLRIFAVAMARSHPNLHTVLQPNELRMLVGSHDAEGAFHPIDSRDIGKYVDRAAHLGLLDESSNPRCLVLPSKTTACRLPGRHKPCAEHTGRASKPKHPIVVKRSTSGAASVADHQPTRGSRDIFAVSPYATADANTPSEAKHPPVVDLDAPAALLSARADW